MNYLEALSKRYSVKKFNNEIIPQEKLFNILESGKLSASSLGLQPYKIVVVESEEMKKKLIPAFYNPSQISTCSHLIVIISKKTVEEGYINGYFRHISDVRETPMENLELFRNSINQHINQKTQDEIFNWAEKQSYIVLANLMYAAAIEGIDSCPMEGFRQDLMEEILDINPEAEKVTVTLALGYRSEEDYFQHMKKVRKPNEKLFKFI
ncbi:MULTISPECIES: NAD(P)H-dependent oxidoreductase [Chryseobacterium]|uniref:Nitroreductase n=1 Tax=Chryseobacterium geocarposphaerae TaxID=1416776 RepID=A0ABU1LF92_9FLAO|nr:MULTISPECIES: NAD(P)H-dependent oxidoreductase [Chryseobacterium]MDR6405398.1 nitroreductase [Chryseobacterium geocarposphaerae]MDR6697557.1 nitroreductase [Chryseobacterium ginsenosidimutans]